MDIVVVKDLDSMWICTPQSPWLHLSSLINKPYQLVRKGLFLHPSAAAPARRRGDRMSAPAASWCDPAGGSPAQVRGSARLVASVAWPLATGVAKRTQRLHGV